jgi:hypothetical protein
MSILRARYIVPAVNSDRDKAKISRRIIPLELKILDPDEPAQLRANS